MLVLAAVLGISTPVLASQPARTRDFIDLSSNNPYPDLGVYAKTHDRVALKVNEGGTNGYVWWAHGQLADQAHKLDLEVWHYDFARPGWGPPASEAGVLVREAKAHWRSGDAVVLDLEDAGYLTDGQLAAWVAAYERTVEGAGLGRLVVYSGWWFVGNNRPHTLTAIGQRPFWFAAYQTTVPSWHGLNVIAWQYTDRANVAGDSRPVDASHNLQPVAKPKPPPSANQFPAPKYPVDFRPGRHPAGAAVQWVQVVLHRKPTGSPTTDPGLASAVRSQQQGWGLPQTLVVDAAFIAKAKAHHLA